MASNSVALWCTHKPGLNGASFEAHINYWRLEGNSDKSTGRSARDFLEIGILLQKPAAVSGVSIFVPLVVARDATADCAKYFQQVELAQGIFNEILSTKTGADGHKNIELEKEGIPFCRIYRFLEHGGHLDEGDLGLKHTAGGTLLEITSQALDAGCRNLTDNTPLYFRLRIWMPVGCSAFVTKIKPTDRWFQSGFEEVEYIDFRLNEARTLPAKIDEFISPAAGTRNASITKISFLTAIPVSATLSVSNAEWHKTRLLEHHIWANYVEGIPDGMMVYHWRKTNKGEPILDFSAFIKMQYRRSSGRTIWTYLLIAFLFGVLGNLTASGIWWGFSKVWHGGLQAPNSAPMQKPTGH